MVKSVLFLGYGIISKGIMGNIRRKRPDLKIYVYSRHHISGAESDNLIFFRDVEEIIGTPEVIISCVADDKDSEEAWGQPWLISYIKEYSPYCIEMSTLSYDYILKWHERIIKYGGKSIESPLTGSKSGAESGTLSLFMYNDFRIELDEFFSLFSKKKYYFSHKGEPAKFKLLYNMWGGVILYQAAEFLPVIEHEFSDKETVYEILSNDGWMAPVCKSILPRVKDRSYQQVNFRYKHMIKDMAYGQKLFEYPLDAFDLVLSKYIYYNKKSDDLDFSVIAELNYINFIVYQLKKYIIENNIKCSAFYTGSFGRQELHYSNDDFLLSDLDYLILIEDYSDEIFDSFRTFADKQKNSRFDVSFILCLKSKFEENVYSRYRQCTDIEHPIYDGLNIHLSEDENEEDKNIFALQPIAFYFSKYHYYQNKEDIYKVYFECAKFLYNYYNKTNFYRHMDLINKIDKSKVYFECDDETYRIYMEAFNFGELDTHFDEISLSVQKLLKVVFEIYNEKLSEANSLESVRTFFEKDGSDYKCLFEKIRNFVFLENQGIEFEKALIH